MAIKTFNYSLAQNTPVVIVPQSNMPQEVHIHNHEHAVVNELYIGPDSNVSASNGHHVMAQEDMVIHLQPDQLLWGMTNSVAGCTVTVLCVQKDA
jgi:hypothetical protein